MSLLFHSLSSLAASAIISGWTVIKNINDPHLKEIANFAVAEHYKQSGEKLKLQSIIKGETRDVVGSNYSLLLKASVGPDVKYYEAVVNEKLSLHQRNLISFKVVH
ncbi:unnamed protein product [Lupinus luteus]|uniref:Cystatin domain-containing protein n=1 Tax=Lupinus luteus TaxID=3873 RepID=A0AAV1VQL8_LUPLU